MNDDEKARFEDWKKRKRELEEKLIKSWKQKLAMLQSEVQSIKIKFEEELLQMYKKRLFYEARIYEQELYIIRLVIMLSDVNQTRNNIEKFNAEKQKLEDDFIEKTAIYSQVLDKLEEFEQKIRMDNQEIPAHDNKVKQLADGEDLSKNKIIEFVKKGKATA